MQATELNNLSVEEYLNIEQESNSKYEYHNGHIYAMAGGTINHGLICGNIFGEIRAKLKEKDSDCKAINSEIKLHIEKLNKYIYLDTMVICGDIKTSDDLPNAVTNPILIVEVLSKSTADYDRGDKFFFYQKIASLQEYILIEQDKKQIDIYTRKKNLWKISRITSINKILQISSLNIKINLNDIYQDTDFN